MDCKYCKEILGIKRKQHGYSLTEDTARRIIAMGPEVEERFKATVHWLKKSRLMNEN